MTRPEYTPSDSNEMTFLTWNILLDKTKTKLGLIDSQTDRLDSLTTTLADLNMNLDVVAIQEGQKTKKVHNGERLSRSLGHGAGFWFEHNLPVYEGASKGRKGEHIGLFGSKVDRAEAIDIGDNRLAIMTEIGGIAVIGHHYRNELWGPLRAQQAKIVFERVSSYDKAVVMGDSNGLPFEKVRRMAGDYGFVSVFKATGQTQAPTYPTDAYRDIMINSKLMRMHRKGVSLDDIYVKGLDVTDAGTFVGDSDHAGIWAKVKV